MVNDSELRQISDKYNAKQKKKMGGHLLRHGSYATFPSIMFLRNIIEGNVEGKRGRQRISDMTQIKKKVPDMSYKMMMRPPRKEVEGGTWISYEDEAPLASREAK